MRARRKKWQRLLCLVMLVVILAVAIVQFASQGTKRRLLPPILARVMWRMAHFADFVEIEAKAEGDYPKTNSNFIKQLIKDFGFDHAWYARVSYYYPAKWSKGPFDLIWWGLNQKFERGQNDDLLLTDFAVRVYDEKLNGWTWKLKPLDQLIKLTNDWIRENKIPWDLIDP